MTSFAFIDKNKLLIKGLLIGLLILLMLIPASLLSSLVQEREARQLQVVREVSSKWAAEQTITGPVLTVPYNYSYKGPDGQSVTIRKIAHFLPDALHITGELLPEVRRRSLYQVTLYRSRLRLEGSFSPQTLAAAGVAPQELIWAEARLLIGINDPRGLEDEPAGFWNGTPLRLEAGVPENGALKSGLSTPISMTAANAGTFSIDLRLRGSASLAFTPVGKTTEVNLHSTWQHPAFDGRFLPDTAAAVNKTGFNAHWKILAASRSYPQAWRNSDVNLQSAVFGVRLIQPADGYAKTERSLKYAILFIALTFIIFFFLEILQKRQVHPLQYLLVGIALCIFYSLLLSISEYTGFNIAYAIAATATVSLIGLYVWGVFRNGRTASGFTAALGGLYGYIYILIQLEDYALLFGSIGLFLILALLMFLSRKIDWYADRVVQLASSPQTL